MTLAFSSAAFAAKPACVLSFDPGTTHVKWTAFKTSEKVAVSGTLDRAKYEPKKTEATEIDALLNGAKFSIEATSMNTANPARDATLKSAFFGKFKEAEITGHVKKAAKGKMDVVLRLNGVEKTVPFAYEMKDDGNFSAKAKIDILDFGMKSQHESLNQACKALHIGKDGVSKTWTEVELELVSVLKKNCGA